MGSQSVKLGIVFILMAVLVVVCSHETKADQYQLWVTCPQSACINYPVFLDLYNQTGINTSDLTQLKIENFTNGIIPFQWVNYSNKSLIVFINISSNATPLYITTNSGGSY